MGRACSKLVLAVVRCPRFCNRASRLLASVSTSGCEQAGEVGEGDRYGGRRPGDAWTAGNGGDSDARCGHYEKGHDRGGARSMVALLPHGVLRVGLFDGGTGATLAEQTCTCEGLADTLERRVLAAQLCSCQL